jgi:putative nucleotidyltransferase with HDIG domain
VEQSASFIERHLIAIADGSPRQRELVRNALVSFYVTVEYADKVRALAGMGVVAPSLILVDQDLPPSGGLEFINSLRRDRMLSAVPTILLLNKEDEGFRRAAEQAGAKACMIKPYRRSELVRVISTHLNYGVEQKWESLPTLQRQALKGTVDVFNSISDIIDKNEPIAYDNIRHACAPLVEAVQTNNFRAILDSIKDYDNYSYAHSLRVATLLCLFGSTIGLGSEEQQLLATGGLLHDVGKMTIPYEVLNKPGRLTPEELVVMRSHVDASVTFLEASDNIPKGIITIAGQHHEKLDGSGYPHGLVSKQLNNLARMAAIVDVFSALTDQRCYKPSMEAETALKIMVEDMPGHLDQVLLNKFRDMLLDAVVD